MPEMVDCFALRAGPPTFERGRDVTRPSELSITFLPVIPMNGQTLLTALMRPGVIHNNPDGRADLGDGFDEAVKVFCAGGGAAAAHDFGGGGDCDADGLLVVVLLHGLQQRRHRLVHHMRRVGRHLT